MCAFVLVLLEDMAGRGIREPNENYIPLDD